VTGISPQGNIGNPATASKDGLDFNGTLEKCLS
jgi:hypothetical protein